jgi:hypothetical protein
MTTLQNVAWVLAIVTAGVCATTPVGDDVLRAIERFAARYPKAFDRMAVPAVVLLLVIGLWSMLAEASGR